jgi:hypothetical protein
LHQQNLLNGHLEQILRKRKSHGYILPKQEQTGMCLFGIILPKEPTQAARIFTKTLFPRNSSLENFVMREINISFLPPFGNVYISKVY